MINKLNHCSTEQKFGNITKQSPAQKFLHTHPNFLHTHPCALTSVSLPELDSVSLVPVTVLWSARGFWGESIFGIDTIVPSSDTWDFSVSFSMP